MHARKMHAREVQINHKRPHMFIAFSGPYRWRHGYIEQFFV
jgi:hypothetical protein